MAYPLPQIPTIAHSPTSPTILSAIAQGATDGFSKANKMAAVLEVALGMMCGAAAIISGCGITSAGLTVTIGTGWAFVNGLVDVASAVTHVVPASSTSYLWLMQAGTANHTATTTPPAGACAYLGKVVTSGSAVTSSDTYGVVYALGGLLWRTTDDAGAPPDSPSSALRMISKTAGGLYLWTGAAHTKID